MSGHAFVGTVPARYDAGMGPVIFEPYAFETASRMAATRGRQWLELAAGTGRVTRHLASALPTEGSLTATDLQAGMLEVARAKVNDPRVRFEVADATALPFPDGSFDAVVSQFGVMFYPDKELGHQEARRVLRPGGTYLLTSWASHAENPWAATVNELIHEEFPINPPAFFSVPFSYNDPEEIEASLRRTGFQKVNVEKIVRPLVAERAEEFARGVILGSPLGGQIGERGGNPDESINRLTIKFTQCFGDNPTRSEMAALFVTARV